MKKTILLTLAIILIAVLSSCKQSSPQNVSDKLIDSVYTQVDQLPLFSGGDTALLKFIAKNTIYPDSAKKNNIQGKVVVKFVVQKDGSVSNIEVLKPVSPLLDKEAIRVVGTLKFENPGKLKGKPVAVWYMVPITFALK